MRSFVLLFGGVVWMVNSSQHQGWQWLLRFVVGTLLLLAFVYEERLARSGAHDGRADTSR